LEKSYGVVKVDYSGRFVIPAKLRSELNLDRDGTRLEVFYNGEYISLFVKQKSCVLCGATGDGFKERHGKHICLTCYDAL
jgi:AbrB family looped-hinge helix DNA binding protein